MQDRHIKSDKVPYVRPLYLLIATLLIGCVSNSIPRTEPAAPVHMESNDKTLPPKKQAFINYDNSLDGQLDSLVRQITLQLSRDTPKNICIKGFLDVKGRSKRLEKYLEAELTNRLIRTGLFRIYAPEELGRLDSGMSTEDLPRTWENGQKPLYDAPIDSILVGSTVDLPQSIKVTVKLASYHTGAVFGAASVLIDKDQTVEALLGRPGIKTSGSWNNPNFKAGDVIKVGENQFVELIPDEYALYVKQINFEFGLFTSNVSSAEIFLNNEYRVMRVDDMISLTYDNDKCVLALRHIMDRTATFTFACLAKGESTPTSPFSRSDFMSPQQDASKVAKPNAQPKSEAVNSQSNASATQTKPSSSAQDNSGSSKPTPTPTSKSTSTVSQIDALEKELAKTTIPPLGVQE